MPNVGYFFVVLLQYDKHTEQFFGTGDARTDGTQAMQYGGIERSEGGAELFFFSVGEQARLQALHYVL